MKSLIFTIEWMPDDNFQGVQPNVTAEEAVENIIVEKLESAIGGSFGVISASFDDSDRKEEE